MIASLNGKIIQLKPFEAVIECQGVGYQVSITLSLFEKWNKLSSAADVFLPIRTVYRENSVTLFGFNSESEALLFDFLNSLQGIGPKNALNLISYTGEETLLAALQNQQADIITKTPGVGKAKADKILFEANQKKKKLEEIILSFHKASLALEETGQMPLAKEGSGNLNSMDISGLNRDRILDTVYEALQTLGFSPKEIESGKKKLEAREETLPPKEKSHIQDWIRLYLKYL